MIAHVKKNGPVQQLTNKHDVSPPPPPPPPHDDQQITHPQQPPAPRSSLPSPRADGAVLSPLRPLFRFFLRSPSPVAANGRMERCTIVGVGAVVEEGVCGRNLSFVNVSSSCNIFPKYKIRKYDGAKGRSSSHSVSHAFHTSSFTLPTVVSGSNDMVRLRPEMIRKVRKVCGV